MFRFDPVPLRDVKVLVGTYDVAHPHLWRSISGVWKHSICRSLAQEKETQPRMTGAVFSTRRLRENQRSSPCQPARLS